MKRFGGDVYQQDIPEVPIPVDSRCVECGEGFTVEDSGFFVPHVGTVTEDRPYHRECFLRNIVGSVGHQKRECSCFGGSDCGDPPGMSIRQAAVAAVEYYLSQQNRTVN